MQIKYDKEADAKYIRINPRKKVARTEEKEDWLLFDYDENSEVVGVEILSASKNPITVLVTEEGVNYAPVKYSFSTGASKFSTGVNESDLVKSPYGHTVLASR